MSAYRKIAKSLVCASGGSRSGVGYFYTSLRYIKNIPLTTLARSFVASSSHHSAFRLPPVTVRRHCYSEALLKIKTQPAELNFYIVPREGVEHYMFSTPIGWIISLHS